VKPSVLTTLFSEDLEEDEDMNSNPGADTGHEDDGDMNLDLGGNTGSNNKDKDGEEPGIEGHSGSEEEEPQNPGPRSNLQNHREPFQTSSSDNPSINLPMGRAKRAEWEKLADLFHLESTYRADALRISSVRKIDLFMTHS
jgi:hypothetical protein